MGQGGSGTKALGEGGPFNLGADANMDHLMASGLAKSGGAADDKADHLRDITDTRDKLDGLIGNMDGLMNQVLRK